MTHSRPEENTLGVVPGGRAARQPASAVVRRILRPGASRRPSLGTGFIGVGAAIASAIGALYGLAWYIGHPNPVPALIAWIVLISVLVATFITSRVIGDQLPDWMFAIFLIGLAAAVWLDLAAIWPLHDIGRNATAALAAGIALIAVITVRGTTEILVAAGALGATLITTMVVNSRLDTENLAAQVTAIAVAVLPAIIAVVVVSGFRRLVQVELDRVLVQSAVSAPRFAVGMMASEELARLDLAAEQLLDGVATGREKLPLDPKTASIAASLATELRLHLIEGRRETWLHHAITESDLLGRSVTLIDKGSLVGLLDPGQRDGLLSAAWLLVSDTAKAGARRTVQLQIGPVTASSTAQPGNKIVIPIVVTTTGVARNRVDPTTWAGFAKVGQYSDSTDNGSLRVDIVCLVDNPADQ